MARRAKRENVSGPCTERRSREIAETAGRGRIEISVRESDSSSWSWAQLEHSSGAESATVLGGAVKVARRVLNQTALGTCPVRRTCEAVQHGLFSGRIDLKYRSPAESAAAISGAVEVARRVADHVSVRVFPILASFETMQHGLLASCADLEDDSAAGSAAGVGGTVKVARRVPHQTGGRVFTVRPAFEVVHHGLVTFRIDLEDCSEAGNAARRGGAVEVARRVADHAGVRVFPVRPATEAVEHGFD